MYHNTNIHIITEKAGEKNKYNGENKKYKKNKYSGEYDTSVSILKVNSWVTERWEPKFPKAGRQVTEERVLAQTGQEVNNRA